MPDRMGRRQRIELAAREDDCPEGAGNEGVGREVPGEEWWVLPGSNR